MWRSMFACGSTSGSTGWTMNMEAPVLGHSRSLVIVEFTPGDSRWIPVVGPKMAGWLCFKMSRDNKRFNDEKAIAGGKCDYHTLVSCCLAMATRYTPMAMKKEHDLVGGLEHDWMIFPYIGDNHPN